MKQPLGSSTRAGPNREESYPHPLFKRGGGKWDRSKLDPERGSGRRRGIRREGEKSRLEEGNPEGCFNLIQDPASSPRCHTFLGKKLGKDNSH